MCESVSELDIDKLCKEVISSLVKEGYIHQVSKKDLEKTIMIVRKCLDERTTNRWIKALTTFGYIIPVTPQIYKINPIKVPDLMNVLRDKSQTRLQ